MVSPISGPTQVTINRNPAYYAVRKRYKQRRPYNLPLPYEFYDSKLVQCDTLSSAGDYMDYGLYTVPAVNDAKIVAYDRFKDAISDRASWGANLAEVGQSLSMISNRITQLARFSREVKRFQFAKAARTLRMSTAPKGVSKHKNVANNWLEYSFGWKPLIADIYSSLDVLQNPIKDVKVRATAKSRRVYPPSSYHPPYSKYFAGSTDSAKVAYGSYVAVNNPNLWLANQMGLINPLTVLWEVIPFSFVVDWFANVEQVLSSFTDFYGLSLTGAYTTVYVESDVLFLWTNYGYKEHFIRHCLVRVPSISGPTLQIRPYKAPGLSRAANAISVLTQLLRK